MLVGLNVAMELLVETEVVLMAVEDVQVHALLHVLSIVVITVEAPGVVIVQTHVLTLAVAIVTATLIAATIVILLVVVLVGILVVLLVILTALKLASLCVLQIAMLQLE